jgi:hypothetical protein
MDYPEWLESLEELAWVRLAATLEDFEDIDLMGLYDQGYSPESAVEFIYEGEDDDEADPEYD